ASGTAFPDALVSGAMGYASAFPVLITDPSTLSGQTRDALSSLGIKTVLIPGGTAAVSSTVESSITSMGIATHRFAGVNRSDTAAKVADYERDNLGFGNDMVDIARGDDPGDSLSGGP